jgi:hypothetical protein
MPRAAVVIAVAPLVIGACGRHERPETTRRSAAAAQLPAPQDTSFAGTTALVQRAARPGARPRVLRAVAATSGPGYDRVVFEFAADSIPGYRVAYTTKPVRRCGSGDPVAVAGAGRLVVRFEPAQAHDERGTATLVERERALGLPAVKEMKLVCDFEGQVEWVLGVAAAGPYRVLDSAGPGRLVLDIRHGP